MLTILEEAEDFAKTKHYQLAESKYTEFINKLETTNTNASTNSSEQLSLAYNNRGYAKYKQVCFDDAVEDYSKAICLNPQLAVAYYNRATIMYRMGDFKRAQDDFQHTLHLNPAFSEATTAVLKTAEQLNKSK